MHLKLPRYLLFVAMVAAFAFSACQFSVEVRTVDEPPLIERNRKPAEGCDCRPNCFCAECECGQ